MTLAWGPTGALRSDTLASVPVTAGVYKLIDDQGRLLYVGESANLNSRVWSHRQRRWGGREVLFSICSLPELRIACQRLEIENDLIAGYYAATKHAPAFQFGVE